MPTLRQRVISSVVRTYPFYSGCGRVANHPWVAALAGTSEEEAWASVPGGQVLAPLDDLMGRAAYYAGRARPQDHLGLQKADSSRRYGSGYRRELGHGHSAHGKPGRQRRCGPCV